MCAKRTENLIKVNTQAVINASNSIKGINKRLQDAFKPVESSVGQMDNSWESPVATTAMNKFNEIKTDFLPKRKAELDEFCKYLSQIVGVGYEGTEDVNVSLGSNLSTGFK